MDKDEVRKLLEQVADGTASVDDAMLRIKEGPLQSYKDMGFARAGPAQRLAAGRA